MSSGSVVNASGVSAVIGSGGSSGGGSTINIMGTNTLASAVKPLTTVANTTYVTQLGTFTIPANTLASQVQVNIALNATNSNSANVKSMWIQIGGVQVGPTITNTTTTSMLGNIIISNNNSMSSQNIVASFSSGTASTGWAVNTSYDATQAQQVQIMGSLATSTDSLVLNSWNATVGTGPTKTSGGVFYGVNGHYTYTATPAQIIAALKEMGMTTYRYDVYPDVPSSLTGALAMAQAFKADGTGLQMYCLIGCSMESDPTNHVAYTSEAAAYAATSAFAQTVASTLYPVGVNFFECGNELDAATAGGTAIRPITASQGTVPTDFTNSVWPLMRGVVCGMIAGVRAGAPNAIVCSNAFTNASIWASDALWNGLQPDGTSGHMQARWDVTAWHLYTEADATNVPYSGGGGQPNFNLLQYISSAYGKPIMISEWNPSQASDTLNASVGTTYLNTWYGNRAQYNILGNIVYSLYDSPWYIIPAGAGSTVLNLFGTAVQTFITQHKDI